MKMYFICNFCQVSFSIFIKRFDNNSLQFVLFIVVTKPMSIDADYMKLLELTVDATLIGFNCGGRKEHLNYCSRPTEIQEIIQYIL